MRLKKCILFLAMLMTTSCRREIQVSMNVKNLTSTEVVNCWVFAGVRDVDIGIIIPDPTSARGHHSFPALVGSNVNVKWKLQNDNRIYGATNVLSEVIKKYEEITILITTNGVVASKNDL